MSSKITRKTTTATASSSSMYSTPIESTSSSSQRSRSPLSPTRLSRLQEKHDLQNLNDRLAVYMDTVRTLENENSRLIKEVKQTSETITRERASYRAMYDRELSDARRLLDEIAGEKARHEIENKRLREENEDLKSSLDKKSKECRNLEANLNLTDHRYADLQTKFNKASADLKRLEDELKEMEKLRKALDAQKKCAENETLARVELENKLISLREEVQFREQILKKEVTELQTKRSVEISEIDGKLTVEYESKLQAALKELREQHELQIQTNRNEITEIYETKLKGLQNYYQRDAAANSALTEEIRTLRVRYDSASGQLASLEAANASLNARIREMEKLLESERTRHSERVTLMEQDLIRSREEITTMLKDYQELMDIKVALDTEIAAYRKLLEFEENRLNISASGPVRRATPSRRGSTPLSGHPAKRRRVLLREAEEMDHFQVTGESKGDLEICDVDPAGKFIQLLNKGTKDAAIGGWTLKHVAGDQETTFKFHRSVKIDPKGNVTVWGADSGRQHEPPQHIVMKMKWFLGDLSNTSLLNNEGEEVATRQRQRVHYTSTSHREEGENDVVDGEDAQREQCRLM